MTPEEIKKMVIDLIAEQFNKVQRDQLRVNPQLPTITGSKGANAALTSLLTELGKAGYVRDNTT